ncbi:MAG: carbohydrate-binding domain-containing protein [Tannerella sp.]|nr:carbohydrate-binding domain-containing protein [Tannerella sp.]
MLLDAEKTFKMQYRFLYVGMLKENSLTTNADLTAMGLPKRSDGGDITITGSKITANDGSNGDDGDIAISGGKITINSGYVVGAGIVVIGKQAGNATVTITGGNFKMSGANGPQPTNGIGDDVYLNIFTIGDPDVGNDMHVTAGSINIVRTDDGRIYKVILH